MSRRRGGWGFSDALDMFDSCGVAEGAAWALAEEMCGLGPGDGVYELEAEARPRTRRRNGQSVSDYQSRRAVPKPLTEERKAAIVARRLERERAK